MSFSNSVDIRDVDLTSGFWFNKQKLNSDITVYAVKERYEETGRFEAFKLNWSPESDKQRPHFFWDSDVAKWMEGACYIYAKNQDERLLKTVDELIDLIEKNQCADGYFNIYHTIIEPENKFKIRDHHELYCLGHLLEASVAYKQATGSDRFIKIMDKYVDCVIKAFVTQKTAAFTTPGHEEIELALLRLYHETNNKKYYDLAMFFIDNRGVVDESMFNMDWYLSNYNQSHLPVREQFEAFGHSVRACYLYTGMASAALKNGDIELITACQKLFDDITQKKMYITGGVGSSCHGEAFTIPYDLMNDTAYTETCASIGLTYFSEKMKNLELNSKYADITELELFNGGISGLSLNGQAFFYENPLEINLSEHTRNNSVTEEDRFPITQRQKNFNCSCCPPNITRYFASVGGMALSENENGIIIHQYMSLNAKIQNAEIKIDTEYPVNGIINITIAGAKDKDVYCRIPGWCDEYSISKPYRYTNGYALIHITDDIAQINLEFVMKPQLYRAHPHVRADAGKVALKYGPIIYCMEYIDNPYKLYDVVLNKQALSNAEITYHADFDANIIKADAFVTDTASFEGLYGLAKDLDKKPIKVLFIPYYAFANRGECDMTVWFRAE